MRQRRAVPGRFLGTVPIEHHEPAVVRGGAEHDLAGHVVVRREHRPDRGCRGPSLASAIASSTVRVRHHRVHRPERLDVVRLRLPERLVAVVEERSGRTRPSPRRRRRPRSSPDRRTPARTTRRSAPTLPPTSPTCARPASGPIRTPSTDGSPSLTPASRFVSARTTSSIIPSGTMVRRIAVHFCPAFTVISFVDLLDEEIELLACPARHRGRGCE